MRIKLLSQLIGLNLLGWVLILVIILFPTNVLRIILGIPFLLFFPGYTMMAALFAEKEGMSGFERLALSFGLSIVVVPLIGLILNYTPWGIKLESILFSVASFILVTSIIAWLRQSILAEKERLAIEFQVKMPGWGEGIRDKVLTIALVIVVLGALVSLGYFIATPKAGETFTEFYILGQGDREVDYSHELEVGEQVRVTVGITNYEGSDVSYRVEVLLDGRKIVDIGPVVVVDEQKWEGETVFVPGVAGENQKVEFILYKGDEVEPCLAPLYLWLNVRGES